jgi:molybdopterin-guanine dinucleotide biosynthesis protein A
LRARKAARPRERRARGIMNRRDITGLVLAGGQGRRMGNVDKGFVELAGRPLVAHIIDRLVPQVATLVINANRSAERYAAFGYPVVADAIGGFAGPLAGLHAGLATAATPFVATSPCDSPFLPADLVVRLSAAFDARPIDIAVARTFDQPHPVFALVRRSVLPHLAQFLDGGGRTIDAWYASLAVAEVSFDDEADAFRNINTPAELVQSAAH